MFRKTTEQYWREQAEAAKQQAALLPHSPKRDALLKKVRQFEAASEGRLIWRNAAFVAR